MTNQVVLENINPVVLEKLQVLAQKHNRSLEDEVKAILESVIESKDVKVDPWVRVNEARQRHAGRIFSDSVELLREDRNR